MSEKTERLEMRVAATFIRMVDDWRRRQSDLPSRSEAIRRLVELGLAGAPAKPLKHKGPAERAAAAAYAEHAAGDAIDHSQRRSDQSKAVKAERKQRLTKVPPELAKRSRSGSRTTTRGFR